MYHSYTCYYIALCMLVPKYYMVFVNESSQLGGNKDGMV